MNPDFLDLLRCLNANKVRYLVIGGYAVILYTEPRYTKDLDIWIEPTLPNAKKVLKSLSQFGAPVDNLTLEELAKPGLVYIFGIPPVRVDVLNKASGCSFQSAWKGRKVIEVDGVKALFVSRPDLIKLKRAANRNQDRADLEKLGVKVGRVAKTRKVKVSRRVRS